MTNLMICLQIIIKGLGTIEVEDIIEITMMIIITIVMVMMITTPLTTPDITEEKIEIESEIPLDTDTIEIP